MTTGEFVIAAAEITMALGTISAVIISLIALKKKETVTVSPQPLEVRINEELHDKFADKALFEQHVKENTRRHAELFARIEAANQQYRKEMDRRFEELQLDRQRTLKELNANFTGLHVDIAAVKTELKIRNERHE